MVKITNGDKMSKEIDLEKYQIRTDLALEALETLESKDEFKKDVEQVDDILITRVFIDKNASSKIGKKVGNYITVDFDDVTDYDNKEKVKDVFAKELKQMLKINKIKDDASCLIIGLGNDHSTPDALGPLVVNNVLVTSPLFDIGSISPGFRNTKAISPGVMGQTGIETSDLVMSVINLIKPDFVLVIDALASQSVERLNKTIQMTDTGIHPGSGIGNKRKEISKEILGLPVIAIGVPTVVDAVTIVSDTINYMHKKYSYTKQNMNNPIDRLINPNALNYLNKDIVVKKEDKTKLLGLVGNLSDNEVKQLIYEVLTPIGYNLMVTVKEVDFIMEKLSDIIGNGINKALHKEVKNL